MVQARASEWRLGQNNDEPWLTDWEWAATDSDPERQALEAIWKSRQLAAGIEPLLEEADLVLIDPLQADAISEWESERQFLDAAAEITRPPRAIFLDLTSAEGIVASAVNPRTDEQLDLAAALVYAVGTDLRVVPFAQPRGRELMGLHEPTLAVHFDRGESVIDPGDVYVGLPSGSGGFAHRSQKGQPRTVMSLAMLLSARRVIRILEWLNAIGVVREELPGIAEWQLQPFVPAGG